MSESDQPYNVLSQRPAVAMADALLEATGVAVVITLLGGPFVGFVAFPHLTSGSVGPTVALGGTFAVVFALFAVLNVGGVLLGAYAAEYRIYNDRVEVDTGIVSDECETVSLDEIHRARLSQGLLESRDGVGDLHLETRGSGAADVTLEHVEDAEWWYEQMRPVDAAGGPLETMTPSTPVVLLERIPAIVLITGFFAVFAGLSSTLVLGLAELSTDLVVGRVAAGFGVGVVALSAGTVLEARNTRYEFFDDHIERRLDRPWKRREFVHANHVENIEFTRGLSGRLFGVGTVAVESRAVSDAFELESIRNAKETYEKLRRVT